MKAPNEVKRMIRRLLVSQAGQHDRAKLQAWLNVTGWGTIIVADFLGLKVPRRLRWLERRRFLTADPGDWAWVPPRPRVELSREPTEDEKRQRILPGVTIAMPLSCYVRNE